MAGALGGGKLARTVASMGQSAAVNAAMGAVNKFVPVQAQRAVNVGAGAVGDLMRGDLDGAGLRLLGSGLLNQYLPGFGGGVASQIAFWETPTPLFGGISPNEAKRIYDDMRGQTLAKKNLWLLEVTSRLQGGGLNMPDIFNLFATELEYAPLTLSGDKHHVGGAVIDAVRTSEPVELRLTTLDDTAGSLKKWFSAHCAAVVAADGTVSEPDAYAVKISVLHAFITSESNQGGHEDIGLFRPANLDVSLSRREDGLQELQMTFMQLDTFMAP
ncbi:MAG: hypothetical protein JNM98_18695 [Rhodocyclaceae bacterium]|nr:hypothetical protein [Rhodocyclaceae bacterium]